MAQGNNDSLRIKSYELGDVVITAGRTPIESQNAARIVKVITKSEIEQSPVQNINDLLRNIAGVDVRQRGPFGAQADISIHGGTYDQTLILLNGINITDPQTGHHNLNLPVDIESIEHVEILLGPAAKSFGPNAFTGAINIITGNRKKNHIRLSAMSGQYSLNKASVNISNSIGSFDHFLSVNRISSNGYIINTDFSNSNIFYQARYSHKTGTTDFQTGFNLKEFGANSFYSLKYPDQFEATKTGFVSLKYESNTRVVFAPAIYLRRNADRFELKRNDNSVPFNHHKTTITGLNLNVHTAHLLGKTSIGIDFRNEYIMSNVLGNMMNDSIGVTGFENTFYTRHYPRMNTSLFAEHSFSWKKLMVNAGILAHHNSGMQGFGIYPGIDVGRRLGDYFRIYSSVNKTLRMPTFTDMFYKSPVQQGNSGLKPEKALTVEGGMKYNNSVARGHVSAFYRRGYNLIDWVKNSSSDSIIWRSMNHTEISFKGLEGSLILTPKETSVLERIGTFRISYVFLQADHRSDMLSKYALDYLRHQITASLDIRIAWKLYNSVRLTWHDRNSIYQDTEGHLLPYKPFSTSDTKIFWKADHYTLYTEASNIFNSEYYDFGGIVQAGIWIRAGLIMDLDYKLKR